MWCNKARNWSRQVPLALLCYVGPFPAEARPRERRFIPHLISGSGTTRKSWRCWLPGNLTRVRGEIMQKAITGLLGAVAALGAFGASQAAPTPNPDAALKVNSFA